MIYVNNIQKNLKKENINTIFNIYIYIPKKFKFKIINNYNIYKYQLHLIFKKLILLSKIKIIIKKYNISFIIIE